jgi:transcriptional regulator with XRE-family HTH domain
MRGVLAQRRISARSIAAEAGWTQSYMSRRINGHAQFTVADLEILAGLLNLPVEFFVADERTA